MVYLTDSLDVLCFVEMTGTKLVVALSEQNKELGIDVFGEFKYRAINTN